jgi:hypothetical protein
VKLKEVAESYDFNYTTHKGEYSRWLKNNGYERPEFKGNGFVLIEYEPERSIRTFSSLDKAKEEAPTRVGQHWQVVDKSTNEVVFEPEWWYHNQYLARVHYQNY